MPEPLPIEEVGRELSLRHHLTYNHFPPVDLAFMDTAERAIDACNDQHFHRVITMPNGRMLTAIEIVEGLHLDTYIDWNGS